MNLNLNSFIRAYELNMKKNTQFDILAKTTNPI